jgi:hypothetical protein
LPVPLGTNSTWCLFLICYLSHWLMRLIVLPILPRICCIRTSELTHPVPWVTFYGCCTCCATAHARSPSLLFSTMTSSCGLSSGHTFVSWMVRGKIYRGPILKHSWGWLHATIPRNQLRFCWLNPQSA